MLIFCFYSLLFMLLLTYYLQPIDFPCYAFHCIFQFKRLFYDDVVLIFTALNNERGSLGYEPYCKKKIVCVRSKVIGR